MNNDNDINIIIINENMCVLLLMCIINIIIINV